MVERSKRAKGKKALLGSHQRSWLWGRNLVMETLLALLLSDKLGEGGNATLGDASGKSRTPELETMRTRIRSELLSAPLGGTNGVKVPTFPAATLPKS